MQEHTGGGDGDDFTLTIPDGGEEEDNDSDGEKVKDEVKDEDEKPPKKISKKTITGRFSRAQLDRFAQSKYFAMFDDV